MYFLVVDLYLVMLFRVQISYAALCISVFTKGDTAMVEFLKSENFIKLVYVITACFVVMVGFVNKREIIDLYKITLTACS